MNPALRAAMEFQRDAPATTPLYRRLLEILLEQFGHGGPVDEVLAAADPALDPVAHALALRLLGGLHRIVLEGNAPALARWYPSAGGRAGLDDPGLTGAMLDAVAAHSGELRSALGRAVQTNEVGRCAALLPGFLMAARAGLPLRIFEVGASAGLNLRWDLYRYEGGADRSAFGPPRSPVRFSGVYDEPLPTLGAEVQVRYRLGCDAQPLDPTTAEGAMTLRSFVWPDQPERLALLNAAVALAAEVPAEVRVMDAADFVEAAVADPEPGTTTVVYHSILWQYLDEACRQRVRSALAAAGEAATESTPIVWLRMEPGADFVKSAEVRYRRWPGGEDAVIARAGYHGRPVRQAAG